MMNLRQLFVFSKNCLKVNINQERFSHYQSSNLWKSVLSVSNQGAKKGRGKRRGATQSKDLNIGQEIGDGKFKVEWPGLNVPVIKSRQLTEINVLGVDENRQKRLVDLRNQMNKFRRLSIPALERGWTGTSLGGKSIGKPLEISEIDFTNFDTRILEYKIVTTTTSILGKKRKSSCLVITGNKNGLIGLGLGKGSNSAASMRVAKSSASQHLISVDLFENRTIFHDFYNEFFYTKIYASKMPKGYGLRCHRIIKTICELAGIKDLYAKLEGSINPNNIAKVFIQGLMKQKNYNELANMKSLNVVEYRPEMKNFPLLLASPEGLQSVEPSEEEEENNAFKSHEDDFSLFVLNNKYRLQKPVRRPFYTHEKSYQTYLSLKNKNERQLNTKIQRMKYLADDIFYETTYPKKPVPKPKTEEETPAE